MTNVQVLNNDKKTIDSREVAEMLGKRHSDLLIEIEGRKDGKNVGIIPVLLSGNFPLSDYFIESDYKDSTGRTLKCYLCTKMGCEIIGNKQRGEKGILFTAKYVQRFNEMEQQLQKPQFKLPTNYKEALIELVATIEEKEKIEAEKNKLIHSSKTYTATELAKELGFKSARAFNEELKDRKIQYKVNDTWVLCARYSECGYQNIKQIELDNGRIVYDRKFTGVGRDWLVNEVFSDR